MCKLPMMFAFNNFCGLPMVDVAPMLTNEMWITNVLVLQTLKVVVSAIFADYQ
jgi:hypothetical protein